MTARYHWPEEVDDGERIRGRDVTVETLIELHAGERFAARHRRARQPVPRPSRARVVPVAGPATTSKAECAFAVVDPRPDRGGRTDRDRAPDVPLPALRRAGGLTIAHEGLVEYELVDVREGVAGVLALTLLRSRASCLGGR